MWELLTRNVLEMKVNFSSLWKSSRLTSVAPHNKNKCKKVSRAAAFSNICWKIESKGSRHQNCPEFFYFVSVDETTTFHSRKKATLHFLHVQGATPCIYANLIDLITLRFFCVKKLMPLPFYSISFVWGKMLLNWNCFIEKILLTIYFFSLLYR